MQVHRLRGHTVELTPPGAWLVIVLSGLSIAKSIHFMRHPEQAAHLPFALAHLPEVYAVLFVALVVAGSRYSAVCFLRGVANFIAAATWWAYLPAAEELASPELTVIRAVDPAVSAIVLLYALSQLRRRQSGAENGQNDRSETASEQ